jgi:hypothetical protein
MAVKLQLRLQKVFKIHAKVAKREHERDLRSLLLPYLLIAKSEARLASAEAEAECG